MKASWIHKIAWPVFIAVLVYYVAVVLKPVLYLHVQQTPFLFTGEYLSRFYNRPGGIVQYLAQFIMQGFHSNWIGTLLLLTILLMSAWLLRVLLKVLFKELSWFWPYVLLIASLLILRNYYFPIIVLIQLIFVLLALIAVVRISFSTLPGWIIFLVMHILVYFVLGPGSSLVFAAGTVIILFYTLPAKAYYKAAVPIIASFLLPYLSFKYIFNTDLTDAYLSFFPPLTILSKYYTNEWFYIYVFLIPLLIGISGIYRIIHGKLSDKFRSKLNTSVATLSLLVLSVTLSAVLLKSTFDPVAKNIALCDYYNYHGSYEKTIDIALSTQDEYDIFINLAYNRAISRTGDFTEHFLDYPQRLGSQILQPDLLGTPVFKMASSELYYDLGYISQSQHAAYAILAIEPDHPRAKMRLVETNILLGNPRAAQVYLSSLADGCQNKEFVAKYRAYIEDPDLISNDPVLAAKAKLIPDNFAIPAQMTERLRDLINKNDSNILAHEYLQACHLLDHQLGDFMKDLDSALGFYNSIPDIYGQAIIMYFFNEEKPGMEAFDINDSSKTHFNDFLRTLAISGNNSALARDSMDFLSDTYMYYVTYLSPKVTNAKVVQEKY